MRVQLALNVADLDEAVSFYSKIFNKQPHKLKNGYANFSLQEPPLKLVLFENPNAQERLNHLGVELFSDDELAKTQHRLEQDDLLDRVEENESCCHAVQNKVWTKQSNGVSWEWYKVLRDVDENAGSGSPCCNV